MSHAGRLPATTVQLDVSEALQTTSVTGEVAKAVGYVVAAWTVAGALETVLSLGTRLVFNPETIVTRWQWLVILLLLGSFASAGAVFGLVTGLLLRRSRPSKDHYQVAAAITITVAYTANWIFITRRSASEYLALSVSILLTAAFITALVSPYWRHRVYFLTGPFTLCLLLLSAPWARHELLRGPHSAVINTAVPLLALMGALIAAKLTSRWRVSVVAPWIPICASLVLVGLLSVPGPIKSRIPPPLNAPQKGKPNIVLITMDTVRADHLPIYGYSQDTSPNLRAFAREATVYSSFFATSDFTLPTHASIFTGMYPGWFGELYSAPPRPRPLPLQPGPATLAEVLGANGYWTVESVANHVYLSPGTGLARGFQVTEWTQPVTLSGQIPGLYLHNRFRRWLGSLIDWIGVDRPYLNASAIQERGAAFLQKAAAGDYPIFLFLNLMDAHWPYVADAAMQKRFLGEEPRFSPPYELSFRVNAGKRELSVDEKRRLISEYDAGIAAEDAALAALFAEMRRLGLYDNALIVVTSDHGEGFLDHGIIDHGQGLVNQNYIHVPLLIKYPRQGGGAEARVLASQVDLLPTVLDVAGLQAPNGVQGHSLLQAPRGASSPVFAEAQASTWNSPNPKLRGTRRAIIVGHLKLITWSAGSPELYDIESDPEERHNLYTEADSRAASLSQQLADFAATRPRPRTNPPTLDPSVVERLRSLGYTQ